MKKNEIETKNSDNYRQSRKERLAKQSKAASKKSGSLEGAKSVASKIVQIVISVVIVIALLGASLNFFGVPQKTIRAVTIDGKSYSAAELSCYYMQIYNYYRYYSSYYDENYGDGYGKSVIGYDTTLSPADQSTTDEDGNTITWDEFLLNKSVENMANTKRYYKLAVDAGTELSEDDKKEIQDTFDSYESYLNGYSMSRYISKTYGNGVGKGLLEKVLTEQKYVSVYQENRQTAIKDGYTDDDIKAEYNKDKSKYDVVNFRWYQITVESTAAATESTSSASTEEESSEAASTVNIPEMIEAQSIIDKIAATSNYNEDTFKNAILDYIGPDDEDYATYQKNEATLLQKISKSTIDEQINEDCGKWLFAQDKDGAYTIQPGDMKCFLSADKKSVYVIYAVGTPYQDDTKVASVRHILVKYPEETSAEISSEDTSVIGEATTVTAEATTAAESTTISDEVKSECYEKAESIMNEYESYINENESGEADGDYFGELASEYSGDTGTNTKGGLIEDMNNNGSYVAPFEDWVFSEGIYKGQERTEGDVDIVETEYGYHVMYYAGRHDHETWYETIQTNLSDTTWEDEQKKFDDSFAEDAISRKSAVEAWVKKSCLKMIERNLDSK